MKKFGLLFSILISQWALGQQVHPFEDNYSYSTGDLIATSGGVWEAATTTTSVPVQVITGNLSYIGYPSSGVGNKIAISGGASRQKVYVQYIEQSTAGIVLYVSFLLKLSDLNNLTTVGDYFVSLTTSASSSPYRNRLWARLSTNLGKFNLGISKVSTPVWLSTDFDPAVTYLVVIAYQIISGSGNDISLLWVNPDLSGSIPLADVTQNTGTDATSLGGFRFEQDANTPNAEIDGIRISTSWSQAPLPVELSSFSALVFNNNVKLNWRTETEVSNYGFEILRSAQNDKANGWEKIGFVEGNGNSNSPKDYSFVDNKVKVGKYSYRLKQIDNDGQFEYSKTIEVDLGAPTKFELSQNYPNPFNPSTTIKFNLPEAGMVKLTLFNILGQEIRTLVNDMKEAGTHTINVDASDLNSGVYIYKIESGSFGQTKKMTLVK